MHFQVSHSELDYEREDSFTTGRIIHDRKLSLDVLIYIFQTFGGVLEIPVY